MENFGAAEVWFGGSKRCTEGEKEDLRATRCGGGRRPALLPAVGARTVDLVVVGARSAIC